MHSSEIETEIKFIVNDFNSIRKKLKKLKGKLLEKGFEYTQLYDTIDQKLRNEKKLLRIRKHGKKFIIGYKKKIQGNQEFKQEQEIEFELNEKHVHKLEKILPELGFQKYWKYEIKFETWKLNGCLLDLDTLPFIQVLEIEGTEKNIQKTAELLNLAWSESSTKNYRQLYEEWLKSEGQKWQDCIFK
ncbi:MAG: class IV adenylate cyclase [Candidatus Diapherotrites archaeon]|nr:class IV adenylate cyclase [Candidatus Diapherotrites archaeon]